MTWLGVPEEVVEGHILPFLKWNDLLRFRRVSKSTHDITTTYMKLHPELAPEIKITEKGDRSLKAFMAMGIPTTKFFLDNESSGYRFYERNAKDIDRFLKEYGSLVKSVRVKELTLFLHGKEWEFLGGLPNLENLEADCLGAGAGANVTFAEFGVAMNKIIDRVELKYPQHLKKGLPTVLANLKKFQLKIGQKKHLLIPNTLCLLNGVTACPGLEYLMLPFNTKEQSPERLREAQGETVQVLGLSFFYLRNALVRNLEVFEEINLKVMDFANYHDELEGVYGSVLVGNGSPHFLQLCAFCLEHDIKLNNVGPSWFNYRKTLNLPPELATAELGKVVVSLVNLTPDVFDLEMPNLERIEIRKTSHSMTMLLPRQNRPSWPNLKSLEINVDCLAVVQMVNGREVVYQTKQLFNLFFKDVRRLALVELCLKFEEGEEDDVGIPKAEDIVSACPNLKKLTIVNWPGKNKALIKFWSGLRGLEEITLENCKQLGNVAFVGENIQDPVFFKLKSLKKLSLRGLDQMPKLTDTLFSLVLRHLKLTNLILTSNRPIKSVTLAGVQALLTSSFKDSIEKFPFTGWSLENVSSAEFKATEKMFRSYNMI